MTDNRALKQFEMPPVVVQQRETVAQRGGAKQKIEVANRLARGPQPATFVPKTRVISSSIPTNSTRRRKSWSASSLFLRVTGIENAFVEFGE
jgi:hypothetical protein